MDLQNKTAVVTGVSTGIGLALTNKLLTLNCKVIGWGRRNPNLNNPLFSFYKVDVSKMEEVEAAKTSLEKAEQHVDILINNAGLGHFGKVDELSPSHWHEMINTNLNGLFYCTRAVVSGMKTMKSGSIINISSVAGLMGIPEGSGYCATKFAVRGLSESLFKELRPFNIKVCCVYPGSTNTNFFDNIADSGNKQDMMTADDVADAIIFLLQSPDNLLPSELVLRPMRVKL